eukprot:1302996-Alexandrium_andersonii.AAC.1
MSASLVGSEMCIRDSYVHMCGTPSARNSGWHLRSRCRARGARRATFVAVSYTHLTLPTICSV